MTIATTIAQRIADAFNTADVDAFAACFTPDAVQTHPFFPSPLRGREAIRAAESTLFNAFDDIHLHVTNVVDAGDRAAIEFAVTATNTRPIPMPDGTTVPATSKTVQLTMSAFLQLDPAGQITQSNRYQDNLAFIQQLGLA